jgi:phytoene dehydrogenase-like protein
VILGQMTTADPSRSPSGTESAWAYTHLPENAPDSPELVGEAVANLERVIEQHAPGFGELVLARRVQSPADLEASEANLVGGAVNGGTANIHQQLVFRPVPGLGRPETPIDGLYLAGSSAHPGGGVHGGPGANAARAALRRTGLTGALRRKAIDVAYGRIYR